MKFSQHTKPVLLHPPTQTAPTTAAVTGLAVLDTQGYGRARITIMAPFATAAGVNAPRTVIVQDSSDLTTYSTYKISGTDFTIGSSGNTAGFQQTLDIDVRESARYIRVNVTPAVVTNYADICVFGELSEGNGPISSLGTFTVTSVVD